jgi:diguanylate cyclase (GGDEF)-like protein
LHSGLGAADEADRKLIEVFSAKISIAFANADHYQKMVSAEEAATTDFLTGLVNRRQLLRLGVPLVAGAHRAGTPLAVAMLDIDHFKRINDTWGHDAGAKVLRRVAALLRERFRTSDVVARFGGEEFCIIATNLDRDAARKLFDAFRSLLEEQVFEIQGQRVPVTVSIGVTSIVADNVDAMISAADAQLFRAKQGGRNRTEID